VQVLLDASSEIAVNTGAQAVVWSREPMGPLTALRTGSDEQPVLGKKGDNLRIDWGYLYLAAPTGKGVRFAAMPDSGRAGFIGTGSLPEQDDTAQPRPAEDRNPLLAVSFDMGTVGARSVSRTALIAYDDLWSIEYLRTRLRPYWRRNGAEAADILKDAHARHAAIRRRCERFDAEVEADLRKLGGEPYVRLGVLAYRQALAGNKLAADASGAPLLFPKENFSNGCIATVDVIYPMAPQFLLFSPKLAKAMLVPVLDYAASPRWKWPFAPHDLGTYPKANGQVYGGGERTEENQMPVEESGNMLILMAALAKAEGNAEFSVRYWPQLAKWADYLRAKGFDPENQLCTDDFAGHLAHNVNLSAKAIMGLASFGMLCDMRGMKAEAAEYRETARAFAERWVKEAADERRYRLAYDRPGTWSQKYNLVWDRILGFGLFPASVLRTETDWYRSVQNRFGLPLDSRRDYTKLDWTVWTACLTGDRADFYALVEPLTEWLNATTSRVALTDWYDTKTGECVGFRARPVVGGLFIKALYDAAIWRKWTSREDASSHTWAPLPEPPAVEPVIPAADQTGTPAAWRYTLADPGAGWEKPGFEDSGWNEGRAGFGSPGTPGAVVGTEWRSLSIWLRRALELPTTEVGKLRLWIHHDEDVEVYLNGVLACRLPGFSVEYEDHEIPAGALATLKPGRNTLAVHCRQTTGGQYVDVGLVRVK
jgi:hypothetical protein